MAQQQQHTRKKSLALFDLELDESDATIVTANDILQDLLTQVSPSDCSKQQAKLRNDAHQVHALALSSSGELNLERFARLLAVRGHRIWLRTGRLDCGCGTVTLRHTVVIAGTAGLASHYGDQLFVIDPAFKEQFALPNGTVDYQALWQVLPTLFVCTAEQLVPIVELMCTQMQRVFAETATSCPPWRTASCMLTKWLPSIAVDVPILAPGENSSGVGCGSSSYPSSSDVNSALSSPAGLCNDEDTNGGLLPPIRTPHQCTGDTLEAVAGLSPRSARSPLYFDQEQVVSSARLDPDSLDEAPAAPEQCEVLMRWCDRQALAVDFVGRSRHDGSNCFSGSGSLGYGAFASHASSGYEYTWSTPRNYHSEDGTGQVADVPRAHGMAIVRRTDSRHDQDLYGDGFVHALCRPNFHQTKPCSPDVAALLRVNQATATAEAMTGGAGQKALHSSSSHLLATKRHPAGRNPTLDYARFDRNDPEVVPTGPLAWLAADSGTSSTAAGVGLRKTTSGPAGSCPPAVRRRGSSTSSQCSALSAAIAGKSAALR